jgi:hypothetical protein
MPPDPPDATVLVWVLPVFAIASPVPLITPLLMLLAPPAPPVPVTVVASSSEPAGALTHAARPNASAPDAKNKK